MDYVAGGETCGVTVHTAQCMHELHVQMLTLPDLEHNSSKPDFSCLCILSCVHLQSSHARTTGLGTYSRTRAVIFRLLCIRPVPPTNSNKERNVPYVDYLKINTQMCIVHQQFLLAAADRFGSSWVRVDGSPSSPR